MYQNQSKTFSLGWFTAVVYQRKQINNFDFNWSAPWLFRSVFLSISFTFFFLQPTNADLLTCKAHRHSYPLCHIPNKLKINCQIENYIRNGHNHKKASRRLLLIIIFSFFLCFVETVCALPGSGNIVWCFVADTKYRWTKNVHPIQIKFVPRRKVLHNSI